MGVKKEKETGTSLFGGKTPEMPEGHYSGDQPNPNLRTFVEHHLKEHPYDMLTDNYSVPAFSHPIKTTKATAIYEMHAYWSKKPYNAIQRYIRHYTEPGDLVLDPFCGSGSTALAALLDGRAAIAIDRSPAATFITRAGCVPVDAGRVEVALDDLLDRVRPEMEWLYETRCDRCGGKAHTCSTEYSQTFQCTDCGSIVALSECPEVDVEIKGKVNTKRVCPACLSRGKRVPISNLGGHFGPRPVSVTYECENGCLPRHDKRVWNDSSSLKRQYFEQYDMGKIREIESKVIPHWYPEVRLEDRIPYRMLLKQDFRKTDAAVYSDLFTKRNLWALSLMFEAAGSDLDLRDFVLAAVMADSRKAQGGGATGYIPGNYHMPSISTERDVLQTVTFMAHRIIKSRTSIAHELATSLMISTQSAENLAEIPDDSVDYVFTDPPYGDNVQYGELNLIWEAWIGDPDGWARDEIIVNELSGHNRDDWSRRLKNAMLEAFRVMKPGRWLSLCFHDTSEGTWSLVQDIMAEAGFVTVPSKHVLSIDTGGRTYNQYTADKVTKRDLVINFRKPRPGEAAADVRIDDRDTGETLNDKVRAIVTDYLTDHAGTTKDRIWDAVVSRMVREGQMQPHDFEALLRDVANEVAEPVKKDLLSDEPPDIFGTHVVGHWYLKSTAYAIEDEAERSKEDAAAAVTHSFIDEFLSDHPEQDGVHYSDLFEHYLTHVTDKSRRKLAEWLPDYFFFTAEGTWKLPATPDEEELKAHERQQGTGRRIRRYLAYLQHHADTPEEERPTDVTLADWIRHCKRAGMYAQGRELYEQGGLILDHLTEEQQVNVQEDYGVCVRKLAEQQVVPKHHRKAKEDADDLF